MATKNVLKPTAKYHKLKVRLDKKYGAGCWYLEPVIRDEHVKEWVSDGKNTLGVRTVPRSLTGDQTGKERLWKFNSKGRCVVEQAHQLGQPYVTMLSAGPTYFSICDQFLRGFSGFDYTRMFGEFDAHQFPKDQGRVLWIRLENHLLWCLNFAPQRRIYPDVFTTTYDLGSVTLINKTKSVGLEGTMKVFVPLNDKVELWIVELKNISKSTRTIDVIPTVPIFGGNRAYVEYHRDVVRLYNKSFVDPQKSSISIRPGLEWIEGQTDASDIRYFMKAVREDGSAGNHFYTDRDSFLGGHYRWGEPLALLTQTPPTNTLMGEEAVGAIAFEKNTIKPGETIRFYVVTGIGQNASEESVMMAKYEPQIIRKAENDIKQFWEEKASKRVIKSNNKSFDHSWNLWWLYQLQLRFWFGNTGHPQFDYGSDFSGWREIWQDMIGTILMDSDSLEGHISRTLEGIRMDGTNATRFFARTKKFCSDETNGLWCDHSYWTTQAILIFAEHTGNPEFLFKDKIRYFRDIYTDRGDSKDESWPKGQVGFAKNKDGRDISGTVLEHLLCQILPMYFDVGKNGFLNIKRADWNDAVDQARGESVTFSMGLVQDCNDIANYLDKLAADHNVKEARIAAELQILLGDNECALSDKKNRLKQYLEAVNMAPSGQKINLALESISKDLRAKAELTAKLINEKAWTGEYYRAYYTENGEPIRGDRKSELAIYLMPQAFAVFSRVAKGERLEKMIASVDKYLHDEKVGGYKLNFPAYTVFDKTIGRITGFAPGTKENNAIFNHANLFYMNAMLRLGRASEAFKVWDGINPVNHPHRQSMILAWLPEYWVSSDNPNIAGKGEYPMLTGSAVWARINFECFVLGIRGEAKGLRIAPCLPQRKDFSRIEFSFDFRKARYTAVYRMTKFENATAKIRSVSVDGNKIEGNLIKPFSSGEHKIDVELI